jgi:hypothetical protein
MSKFNKRVLYIMAGFFVFAAIISALSRVQTVKDQPKPASNTAHNECTRFGLALIKQLHENEAREIRIGLPTTEHPGEIVLVGSEIDRAFVSSVVSEDGLMALASASGCTRLKFWQSLSGFGDSWTYRITPDGIQREQ